MFGAIQGRPRGETRNNHDIPERHGGDHRHRSQRVRFPAEVGVSTDTGSPFGILLDMVISVLAIVCVAGLMTILVILYVTVRPFSLPLYRRLAAQFGAASIIDALAILLPNTKICVTGDSDVPSPVGTSVLVSNHLLDGDWWALIMLGRCIGLRGTVKFFLRNEYLQVKVQQNGERLETPHIGHSNSFPKLVAHRNDHHEETPPDLAIGAQLLHSFLEFPLLNGDDRISDREQLFKLLRSFGENSSAPVHLLFFPEGWSMHNGTDRRSLLAKSNEFAKREGRPQLKHLLLPRSRGFNASLECLRESNPVVYDVTMAYIGYDGSLPPSMKLSLRSLWKTLRHGFPREIHIRLKRYSMEEVLQDSTWLDKKWAEKDRLLSFFARNQAFPLESRGYAQHRVFETRHHSLESSLVALFRLLLLPFAVPVLLLLSIPLFWTLFWIWVFHRGYKTLFSDPESRASESRLSQTPGSASSATPVFPATPFASPSVTNWRDVVADHRE